MTQDLGKRRLGIHRLTGSAPIAPRRRPAATAHSVPATPRSRLDWHKFRRQPQAERRLPSLWTGL